MLIIPHVETSLKCYICGAKAKDRPRDEKGNPTDIWVTDIECGDYACHTELREKKKDLL